MTENPRTYLERFQAISRIGRKPKPVVFIDIETHSAMSMDPGKRDALRIAYSVGSGSVHVVTQNVTGLRYQEDTDAND